MAVETLIDLVTSGAARFGEKPALMIRPSFRTRVWRYEDLGRDVPRAARVLADSGVERGDRVIVWAVNRPEWGLGFLATAHLGAVSVPIDVRHPTDFAQKIVAQTDARIVLASRQTAEGARALGLPIVWIEQLPDLARRADPIEPASIGPDDLAEIVFTSGTTGDPKGAMISHGNLLTCTTSLVKVFPFGPKERLLSVLPLSHLFEQVIGFIAPLQVGASVVYPVSRQPAVLVRTFREYKVTMLLIVPQGLRLLDNAIERKVDQSGKRERFERAHRMARRLPTPLRRILFRSVLSQFGGKLHTIGVGASALDVDVARRWMDMGVSVLQGYGATEMSPVVSFTRPARNRLGTVGEAIPGVEIRIAEDGEILARGPNRFGGYWQNPEATAKVIDADGWYHSGDLGQLSPDGFLTFRGRKKDMLAMPDGQKVYPEDLEDVLDDDARVREATVVGWPPGPDLKVHAVLVLDDPSAAGEVVKAANGRLGAHQQIRAWTIWPDEELPRTHTLKVKKHEVLAKLDRLVDSPAGDAVGAGRDVPARAASVVLTDEERLAEIVAGIGRLPVSAVTPAARLSSDLNLDSLQRVELLGVIEEEFGTYVPDDVLDPEATILELMAIIDAARGVPRPTGIYGWPLHPAVRLTGLAIQTLLIRPFVFLTYRVRKRGLEHLDTVDGPVLFTPNHCLHLDNAILLSHMPLEWRWNLSVAAAADSIFDNPVRGFLASLLANAFPIHREGNARRSLELLGARLDRGFNILIYPEGKLTVGGPLQPFKAGAGLLAVEGATPVVPMKLNVHRMHWLDRGPFSFRRLRGDVELVIGAPIWFDADMDHAAATTRLEEAVAAL
jgi:long-chain acyl-CoA synthetase